MAGVAGHLRRIARGSQSFGGIQGFQWVEIISVEVAHHPNAVPRGDPLGRTLLPNAHRAGLMTVGAINAQRIGHIHHQGVGPFRLFDRIAVIRGQCRGSLDRDLRVALQVGRQGIERERRVADGAHASRILPCFDPGDTCRRGLRAEIRVPGSGRDRLAAMTGPTGDPGPRDMRLPVGIDIPGHPQHLPRNDLRIFLVRGQVLGVVAIFAALLRGDPGRDGLHQACEFEGVQVGEDLNVFIDVLCERNLRIGRIARLGRGDAVKIRRRLQSTWLVDMDHGGTAFTPLHALRAITSDEAQETEDHQAGHHPRRAAPARFSVWPK